MLLGCWATEPFSLSRPHICSGDVGTGRRRNALCEPCCTSNGSHAAGSAVRDRSVMAGRAQIFVSFFSSHWSETLTIQPGRPDGELNFVDSTDRPRSWFGISDWTKSTLRRYESTRAAGLFRREDESVTVQRDQGCVASGVQGRSTEPRKVVVGQCGFGSSPKPSPAALGLPNEIRMLFRVVLLAPRLSRWKDDATSAQPPRANFFRLPF